MKCNNCPRHCNVDRINSVGVCGVGEGPRVAKAYLHMWEEPIISGTKGSGTIFFSGCNLKCVYCQNYEISSGLKGKDISVERLAEIFKELEEAGAHNINLVSPTHYVHSIKQALNIYRPNIPIVYNSSGYEDVSVLEDLVGYIDIYLVDFKYADYKLADRLSHAPNYPEVAKKAILKMREHQPKEVYDNNGMLIKGVVIRHLVLPNHLDNTFDVLAWIKDNVSAPLISIMCQYTPVFMAESYNDINRKLKPIEYKMVLKKMEEFGLNNGFTQELSSAKTDYIPDWNFEGV